ncbi:MAG: ImmA/IrrE family metallo-endopeptidase [Alicyclobacillus macrosporangiidus]|uniref:ImmA/IrrE family metallo-endopeptidase n=1 Tax=Alicyclobacillus macrosporangiidus TaxID=392015 RepID=UPI0026F1454E|nr:ImmA/IrrE family metallo-endopeptidase [Alicyclobacillus macrosporangiidus]MCL6598958.1 ImmA/IrrE family metallo-endopeptidase [Alicyclobacillus macrosporangiidus]
MDLDKEIERWYRLHDIYTPDDIDLDRIAQVLGVDVREWPGHTVSFYRRRIILLRTGLSEIERREVLAHELAHFVLHCGGQAEAALALAAKQEWQAERAARKILIPLFMLRESLRDFSGSNVVASLSWLYRVSSRLVLRRLEDVRWIAIRIRQGTKFMIGLVAIEGLQMVVDAIVGILT